MSVPLGLISGLVTDLAVQSGEEGFIRKAGQQAAGVGAAAGLAAIGLAGAGAGASLAAASAGDSVEFFSCKVGGQTIEGRFSKTSFKVDDEVTAVLKTQTTSPALALAIKRERDSMLWTLPHCSRGIAAHRAFAFRMFCCLLIGLPTFFMCGFLLFGIWMSTSPTQLGFIEFMGAIDITLGVIAAGYYSLRFYRQWLPISHQAEAIFAALGYLDPSRVDLPRDHKRYCKANGIKWPYLTDGPWIYHYLDPRK